MIALLKTGTSEHGSVLGPAAEVVFRSTQHLVDADLRAIAVVLKGLPQNEPVTPAAEPPDPHVMRRGADLYRNRCADCHGDRGQGARGAYPPLAGNPRPYGMPPFGHALSNAETAAVETYVRNAWGNRATAVSELDVIATK